MASPAWLKRKLRPVAFAVRRARQRAGSLIRPPLAWDGRHHPALLRFEPWSGEADGTFVYDFLGIKTDPRFRPQFRPQPRGPLATDYPSPHAAYFELVFVLESVLAAAAAPRFSMLELGAGYGPWLVTADRAAKLSSGVATALIGVEMVPHHFRFMHEHLRNNGIDPAEHTLIHAAVSDFRGQVDYRPEIDLRVDYGQNVTRRIPDEQSDLEQVSRKAIEQHGRPDARAGDDPVRVPCIRLRELLRERGPIDLVHVDVQGEELRALGDARDELNRRVRRLIVATHSRRIHLGTRRLIGGAGWSTVYDFGYRKRVRTEFGDIQFLDGLLAFVNPATV